MTFVRLSYPYRQFCDFCNNFVTVPGYGVHLSYPYPGEVCDFYTLSYPTRGRFVSSVQHHTLPERFCDFCTTFIPLPDSSVIPVTTSYRYQGMGYTFLTRTWRISVTSVQHYTQPDKFCDFCTPSIPVPGYGVHLPYPTRGRSVISVTVLFLSLKSDPAVVA